MDRNRGSWIAAVALVAAAAGAAFAAGGPQAVVTAKADLKWADGGIPGVKTAAVEGDMAKGASHFFLSYPAGFVTLHSRESLAALAAAANAPDLSELRFRSNIAVDGVEAWAEQAWIGRKLRIGAVDFEVAAPKTRCRDIC